MNLVNSYLSSFSLFFKSQQNFQIYYPQKAIYVFFFKKIRNVVRSVTFSNIFLNLFDFKFYFFLVNYLSYLISKYLFKLFIFLFSFIFNQNLVYSDTFISKVKFRRKRFWRPAAKYIRFVHSVHGVVSMRPHMFMKFPTDINYRDFRYLQSVGIKGRAQRYYIFLLGQYGAVFFLLLKSNFSLNNFKHLIKFQISFLRKLYPYLGKTKSHKKLVLRRSHFPILSNFVNSLDLIFFFKRNLTGFGIVFKFLNHASYAHKFSYEKKNYRFSCSCFNLRKPVYMLHSFIFNIYYTSALFLRLFQRPSQLEQSVWPRVSKLKLLFNNKYSRKTLFKIWYFYQSYGFDINLKFNYFFYCFLYFNFFLISKKKIKNIPIHLSLANLYFNRDFYDHRKASYISFNPLTTIFKNRFKSIFKKHDMSNQLILKSVANYNLRKKHVINNKIILKSIAYQNNFEYKFTRLLKIKKLSRFINFFYKYKLIFYKIPLIWSYILKKQKVIKKRQAYLINKIIIYKKINKLWKWLYFMKKKIEFYHKRMTWRNYIETYSTIYELGERMYLVKKKIEFYHKQLTWRNKIEIYRKVNDLEDRIYFMKKKIKIYSEFWFRKNLTAIHSKIVVKLRKRIYFMKKKIKIYSEQLIWKNKIEIYKAIKLLRKRLNLYRERFKPMLVKIKIAKLLGSKRNTVFSIETKLLNHKINFMKKKIKIYNRQLYLKNKSEFPKEMNKLEEQIFIIKKKIEFYKIRLSWYDENKFLKSMYLKKKIEFFKKINELKKQLHFAKNKIEFFRKVNELEERLYSMKKQVAFYHKQLNSKKTTIDEILMGLLQKGSFIIRINELSKKINELAKKLHFMIKKNKFYYKMYGLKKKKPLYYIKNESILYKEINTLKKEKKLHYIKNKNVSYKELNILKKEITLSKEKLLSCIKKIKLYKIFEKLIYNSLYNKLFPKIKEITYRRRNFNNKHQGSRNANFKQSIYKRSYGTVKFNSFKVADFDNFFNFVSIDLFPEIQPIYLKLFFTRFYSYINLLHNYSYLNNIFVFYFFCKLYSMPGFFFRYYKRFSLNFLVFSDFKSFNLFDILFSAAFKLRVNFFFPFFIYFNVIKYSRFILRVDIISYVFLRYFLEGFRIFKYNEYINNHNILLFNPSLRDYLRRGDPLYNYSVHIFLRYKKIFRLNRYNLVKFYYQSFENAEVYYMISVEESYFSFCVLNMPFLKFFFVFFYFSHLKNFLMCFFPFYISFYGLFYDYMVYLNSNAYSQWDDLIVFTDTFRYRSMLSRAYADSYVYFGPFFFYCKASSIKYMINSPSFNCYSAAKLFLPIYTNWYNGFFYEIFYFIIVRYVSYRFMYSFLDMEFLTEGDTMAFLSKMIFRKSMLFTNISSYIDMSFIDFKYGLDVLIWELFSFSFLQTVGAHFFNNLTMALKKIYIDTALYEFNVKFFFLVDYMTFEFFGKSHLYILNFIYFFILRDFIFRFIERLLIFNFFICYDFYSLFYFYLKLANSRIFRYKTICFFNAMLLNFEPVDRTFI